MLQSTRVVTRHLITSMSLNSVNTDNNSIISPGILLFKEWVCGGTANAITSALLNPMDVAKTRLQSYSSHNGLGRTLLQMYYEGGIIGLWSPGLTASIIREMVNSGARAGLYTTVRNQISVLCGNDAENKKDSLFPKICSALTTGTIGAVLANPVDVIKIRLMSNPKLYPTTLSAFPTIISKEGFIGLYKGVFPSTLRGAFIAVGELATYDHSKWMLKHYFCLNEGSLLHVCSSLITGLIATTVAAPFDMIKTRAMSQTSTSIHNPIVFLSIIVKREGFLVLFRGWLPAYLRLGPHALICFPIFERLRHLMGLEYI